MAMWCALVSGATAAGPARVLAPRDFRFARSLQVAAGPAASACAVLDAATYAHARASLDDVRLFSGPAEVPYALTLSNTSYFSPAREQARVLNLGMRGGQIVFDLAMPARAYTRVDLALRGEDFLATAKVKGSAQAGHGGTDVGTFTLFDLTGQKLGRNTSLPLPESTFAFLHVSLDVSEAKTGSQSSNPSLRATPAMVVGATVPPSREAEAVYTEVARTAAIVQKGTATEARFDLPARVPVERVRFELAPADHINFSRRVLVAAHPGGAPADEREEIEGEIARVRVNEGGRELRNEHLSVAATLGANARDAAAVVISIENGDDQPLPISAVVLEMRQRKLCFNVPSGPVELLYGDAGLAAPRYDFSRVFVPSEQTRAAALGAEELNPRFVAPADARSFIERHPGLIWMALLGAVGGLGLVALRSGRQIGRKA